MACGQLVRVFLEIDRPHLSAFHPLPNGGRVMVCLLLFVDVEDLALTGMATDSVSRREAVEQALVILPEAAWTVTRRLIQKVANIACDGVGKKSGLVVLKLSGIERHG